MNNLHKLNRSAAIEYMRTHANLYLQPDGCGQGYMCPICGSGSGPRGTGLTTRDNVHFTCWSDNDPNCKIYNSDIFDIIGFEYNLTSFEEKLEKAAELFEVEIVNSSPSDDFKDLQEQAFSANTNAKTDYLQSIDFDSFFELAQSNLEANNYTRGISFDTLRRFGVGFVEDWRHPKPVFEGKHVPPSPRLIIPTGKKSYIARDTREDIPPDAKPFAKQKVGHVHIFNLDEAVKRTNENNPLIITEGELDALSILDKRPNAACLALGSVSNAKLLLSSLEANPPQGSIIVALDADTSGRNATDELARELNRLGLFAVKSCSWDDCKDANELLNKAPGALGLEIDAKIHSLQAEEESRRQTLLTENYSTYFAGDCESWYDNTVIRSQMSLPISTGFKKLDALIGGGFEPLMYVLGAVSNIGKTTFALQLATDIAMRGEDVLFFSFETPKEFLFDKTISRLTFQLSKAKYASTMKSVRR